MTVASWSRARRLQEAEAARLEGLALERAVARGSGEEELAVAAAREGDGDVGVVHVEDDGLEVPPGVGPKSRRALERSPAASTVRTYCALRTTIETLEAPSLTRSRSTTAPV